MSVRAFGTHGRGARRVIQVNLDTETCEGIATMFDQVVELLAPDEPGDGTPEDPLVALTGMDPTAYGDDGGRTPRAPFFSPDDPAVARLLPDAHRDDPALAEEFRRLTEHGLRRRKTDSLTAAAAALRGTARPLTLDAAQAQALLTGLTDVRLVLAERLGLRDDDDATALHAVMNEVLLDLHARGHEVLGEHLGRRPWLPVAFQYDQLTQVQEDLVHALTKR